MFFERGVFNIKKQMIRIFEATYKADLEKEVESWLNDGNNKHILNMSASNRHQYGGYMVVVHYEGEYTFDDRFKPFINHEKITITDFKEKSYSEKMCIHCDTEGKAKTLFEYLKSSINGVATFWGEYRENTCYTVYGYGSIKYFKDNGYTIYEFEDVIFD